MSPDRRPIRESRVQSLDARSTIELLLALLAAVAIAALVHA